MMLKFSYHAKTPNNATMKYLIHNLSVSNLLVGAIAMPCNMYTLVCNNPVSCNIACLSRYFFTFIFSSNSLMVLTILCNFRRDLIIKVPFGKPACVTKLNKSKLMIASSLVSLLPNLALSLGYLYLLVIYNTAPCRPDEKHKTTHYYLGISEGLKTGVLFSVCFTFIISAVSKIRKTLAMQAVRVEESKAASRRNTHARISANIYFAVVFIVMWIPFSIIAAFSSYIPSKYYEDAFTVGYTLAYTCFALLPICYAMTDSNFKLFCRKIFSNIHAENRQPLNVVLPVRLKDITTSTDMGD